jgi:Calcineurin-like phosphoesterase
MKSNTSRLERMLLVAAIVTSAVAPSAAWCQSTSPSQQAEYSRRPLWKFAVTDDSRAAGALAAQQNGVATVVLGTIASDIVAQGVDFVLFPGDMVTGETNDSAKLSSELDTWIQTMAPVYTAGIPVYVTRGNHEYNPGPYGSANPLDPSRQTFLDHFSYLPRNGPTGEKGLTWSITHKNVKLIGFDEYANRSSSYNNTWYAPGSNHGQDMNGWVIGEIESSTSPLNFVIAHEQIWPTQSHKDCLANDPDSRDALVHALAAHGGAFLAGHDHMYVRGVMTNDQGDKVPAFTVGTAGGGNYAYAPFDALQAGYTGSDRYTVEQVLANSTSPIFGYLLVTVYSDDTWSADFRGFQFNSWKNEADVSLTPISVMDAFTSASMLQ